jgi:hypothetical protein
MTSAPNFDHKMLLLATQVTHQSGRTTILLAVLEELLNLVKASLDGNETVSVMESLTLVRCVIRLCAKLLDEKGSNK